MEKYVIILGLKNLYRCQNPVNTPRQGLFASLLFCSFILHGVLIVVATQYYLKDMREKQGDLIAQQFIRDSVNEFEPTNQVGLALLATRYATDPAIASIRVLDKNNQTLATAGNNKTRHGDIFVHDAIINEQKVGHVEVILLIPTFGEQIHRLWLPILGAFLLHLGLWIGYRILTRGMMKATMHIATSTHTQNINPASATQSTTPISQQTFSHHQKKSSAQQHFAQNHHDDTTTLHHPKPIPKAMPQPTLFVQSQEMALLIKYDDPQQLLDTLSPKVAQRYFALSKQFLEHTVRLCETHFQLRKNELQIIRFADEHPAVIKIYQKNPLAIQALIQVAMVYQMISDQAYQRLREKKSFALQSCCAIAEDTASLKLMAEPLAAQLLQQLQGKQTGLYVSNETLNTIQHHYAFAFEQLSGLLKDARLLRTISSDLAEVARDMVNQVLNPSK